MTGRRVLGMACALLLAASLAEGAGASAAPSSSPAADRARARVTKRVNVVDFAFMPKTVNISRNTYVKWVNTSGRTHTTTSNTGLWNRSLAAGARYRRQFTTAGPFRYRCTFHAGAPYYMTGKIVVT